MTQQLLTVSEIADRLQVQPSWVYTHADALGAIRIGKYLRFEWELTIARIRERVADLGPPPNDPDGKPA